MLSLLAKGLGTPLGLFLLILPVLPFLVTWILSSLNANRSRNGEPPMIPYAIPWLGHGFFFVSDMNGFGSWLRKKYPNREVSTVLIGGKHLYNVVDRKLVSLIYRRPRSFTFDPLLLIGLEVFGATKADINVMKIGMPGVEHGPRYTDDGRRMAMELHQQLAPNLDGKNMVGMLSRFTKTLVANLEQEFATDGALGPSGDWTTLDFCDFARRHLTHASIPSLFGSHLMKIWPRVYEEFWTFDQYLPTLLLNLPRTLIPAAFESRDKVLSVFSRWQTDAERYRDFKSVEMADPDWDEYWGTRLMRARHRTCLKNGISKRGRPAFEVAMLWGLNANAIPVAMWMLIQTICDPALEERVRSAIASYQKQDGTFDVGGLVTHPLLKSIFLETLRFSVGSPSIRIVQETTQLGGYTFHKGNIICIPTRELQMDTKVWSPGGVLPDPSRFWAERFLDLEKNEDGDAERVAEALEASAQYAGHHSAELVTNHYKLAVDPLSAPGPQSRAVRDRMLSMRPFGGGISLCPGRNFAMYETIAGLAIMLSTFDFEVDQAALRLHGMPRPQSGVIGGMGPDRKLIVRMRRRKT